MVIKTVTLSELEELLGPPDHSFSIDRCVEMIEEKFYTEEEEPRFLCSIYGAPIYNKALERIKEKKKNV